MTIKRPNTIETLEVGLRRVLAPNPSPLTYWGTNTYIVGSGSVAVIDPGPADNSHLNSILSALKPGEIVSHILITHSHIDHSPLAKPLSAATGAQIYAFGDSESGRSEIMKFIAKSGQAGGGEGVDADFKPDVILTDNQEIQGDDWSMTALWTPGHFGNHMSFRWNGAVFTGDQVMAWASSLVSPPDGDLTDFMNSCEVLARQSARAFYPGHGPPINETTARIEWLINHRRGRETAVLGQLSKGVANVRTLTRRIYVDSPDHLFPAAERNVFAHLVDLVQKNQVTPIGSLTFDATFGLTKEKAP